MRQARGQSVLLAGLRRVSSRILRHERTAALRHEWPFEMRRLAAKRRRFAKRATRARSHEIRANAAAVNAADEWTQSTRKVQDVAIGVTPSSTRCNWPSKRHTTYATRYSARSASHPMTWICRRAHQDTRLAVNLVKHIKVHNRRGIRLGKDLWVRIDSRGWACLIKPRWHSSRLRSGAASGRRTPHQGRVDGAQGLGSEAVVHAPQHCLRA